jgi:tRNA pseudouridine38-40 synthase
VESALTTILRIERASLTVAGRTDAGVHARGQVCHVDLPAEVLAETSLERLTYRLSRLLPEDIRVRRVTLAPGGFDARFSACWRRYVYRVSDDPFAVDPLTRHTVLWWPRRLDVPVMHRAAQPLLGEHDFAAFCKRRDGATTIRTLHELTWTREGDRVTARVVADAFCHHMVRALVGCLLTVGEGHQDEVWPGLVLEGRSRDPRVRVVSAHGLSLEEVGYPVDDAELAAQAAQARAVRTMA